MDAQSAAGCRDRRADSGPSAVHHRVARRPSIDRRARCGLLGRTSGREPGRDRPRHRRTAAPSVEATRTPTIGVVRRRRRRRPSPTPNDAASTPAVHRCRVEAMLPRSLAPSSHAIELDRRCRSRQVLTGDLHGPDEPSLRRRRRRRADRAAAAGDRQTAGRVWLRASVRRSATGAARPLAGRRASQGRRSPTTEQPLRRRPCTSATPTARDAYVKDDVVTPFDEDSPTASTGRARRRPASSGDAADPRRRRRRRRPTLSRPAVAAIRPPPVQSAA